MEDKITIGSLSGALMQTTGKGKKVCDDFLKEFFKLAAETLKEGETLRIKSFGTFKVVKVEGRTGVNVNTGEKQEIAPYKKVVFTPAKEMASAINSPFEEFSTIELDEELPEDLFYETDEEISDENEVSTERMEEGSDEEGTDDLITLEAYNIESNQEPIVPEIPETPISETGEKEEPLKEVGEENVQDEESASETQDIAIPALPVEENKTEQGNTNTSDLNSNEEEPSIVAETPQYQPDYSDYEPPKSRFGMGFLLGALSMFAVCAVVFIIGCFCDWWPENLGFAHRTAKEEVAPLDTLVVEEVPQVEVVPQVLDTVSTTRYLTTIAREKYGNFNFWPYIYMANDSILGHPDRITPGTVVIVPDIKDLGLDPQSKNDEEKAKQLAAEIYAKYKKGK